MGAPGAVCSDKGPPSSLTEWRGHHRVITGATLTVRGARRLLIRLLLPASETPDGQVQGVLGKASSDTPCGRSLGEPGWGTGLS